jgi:hypothetical protein
MIENVFPDTLIEEARERMAADPMATFALIGHTSAAYRLVALFRECGQSDRLLGIYDKAITEVSGFLRPLETLHEASPSVAILCMDEGKEGALLSLEGILAVETHICFAGQRQYDFQDPAYREVRSTAHVESWATGYPETLIHIFECLRNAARLGLEGKVVEFGMFRGGTTKMIARFIERLGCNWPVVGFDTFAGFPAKRSIFDMYAHPDCVWRDVDSVRRYVAGHNIEIVEGDIVQTVSRLEGQPIILAFVDTDNFTPANAVVNALRDQIVVGGAFVFDHYTGRMRHRYTLGERMAARPLVEDRRYFNLHNTGVFLRQI